MERKVQDVYSTTYRESPFDTNIKFCHDNELHEDYVYHPSWVDQIVALLKIIAPQTTYNESPVLIGCVLSQISFQLFRGIMPWH